MSEHRELWLIEPRDPLVLGDGRGFASPGAFLSTVQPGTVAGMVRTAFVRGQSQVSREDALGLLNIKIRGPWLRERRQPAEEHQSAQKKADLRPTDIFPVGSDVLCDKAGKLTVARVGAVHARPLKDVPAAPPAARAGVLWQKGAPRELWPVSLPDKDPDTQEKLRRPDPAFWPLDELVQLAVGKPASHVPARQDRRPLTEKESRTHVVIEPGRGTASPGLLFSTDGVRLHRDLALAVEVSVPDAFASRSANQGADLVVLGGESRLSFRSTDQHGFPAFVDYKDHYEASPVLKKAKVGLRLQLLTPGFLKDGPLGNDAGWLPRWLDKSLCGVHPDLPAVKLQLRAVCMNRAVPVSGWNMQAAGGRGAPREVRRLVPAGTVYYFEVLPTSDEQTLRAACAALWGQTLDPSQPNDRIDETNHRAPAAWDGYGLILPGFWEPTPFFKE